MPDPWGYFSTNMHNYYDRCLKIYEKENKKVNNNQYVIYNLGPINNTYNVLSEISEIQDFSNKVTTIFDKTPNNQKPGARIKFENVKINYRSSDKKLILTKKFVELNDELFRYVKKISLKVISILEKDLNIYINPYNFQLYRNLQINKNLITSTSFGNGAWKYHCDHDPPFKFKVFIYLTDVDENKAPFEIIYHPKKNIYPKMIPYGNNDWSWGLININYTDKLTEPYFQKKKFSNVYLINPNTRIPDKTLQKLKNDGFIKKKITGKKGTMIACQAGLVHRANIGIDGYRDLLIIECVPSLYKINENNCIIQNIDKTLNGIDILKFYKNLVK